MAMARYNTCINGSQRATAATANNQDWDSLGHMVDDRCKAGGSVELHCPDAVLVGLHDARNAHTEWILGTEILPEIKAWKSDYNVTRLDKYRHMGAFLPIWGPKFCSMPCHIWHNLDLASLLVENALLFLKVEK